MSSSTRTGYPKFELHQALVILESLSLTSFMRKDYLIVSRSDFDLTIFGEPYIAQMLFYNLKSGQFLARLWNKTVSSGRAMTLKEFHEICEEHFYQGGLCLGCPVRDEEQGEHTFLVAQSPIPRKMSKACKGFVSSISAPNSIVCEECANIRGPQFVNEIEIMKGEDAVDSDSEEVITINSPSSPEVNRFEQPQKWEDTSMPKMTRTRKISNISSTSEIENLGKHYGMQSPKGRFIDLMRKRSRKEEELKDMYISKLAEFRKTQNGTPQKGILGFAETYPLSTATALFKKAQKPEYIKKQDNKLIDHMEEELENIVLPKLAEAESKNISPQKIFQSSESVERLNIDLPPEDDIDFGHQPDSDGGLRLRCNECNKNKYTSGIIFKNKRSFNEHVREKHTGQAKVHPCPRCGATFARKSNMTAHMRNNCTLRHH